MIIILVNSLLERTSSSNIEFFGWSARKIQIVLIVGESIEYLRLIGNIETQLDRGMLSIESTQQSRYEVFSRSRLC